MKSQRPAIRVTDLRDRIRSARRAAKMSQSALAAQLGVTPGAVAHWERPGGAKPGVERLASVAAAVNVSFDWLATGNGNRRRGKLPDEVVPAIVLDAFARNIDEEQLLAYFRGLSAQARASLLGLLRCMSRS